MQPRRASVADASYAITADLAENHTRGAIALVEYIGVLHDALRHAKSSRPVSHSPLVVLMKMGQQPLATANKAGVDVGLGEASPTYGLYAQGVYMSSQQLQEA